MSDLSVKIPAYGIFAASAAIPAREGESRVPARPQEAGRGDPFDAPATGVVRAPDAADASLKNFEKMIARYVPKDLPNTRLQIEHDEGSGLFVYRAIDKDTGEVVRQYPTDEILRFISYFRESEGLVVDGRA